MKSNVSEYNGQDYSLFDEVEPVIGRLIKPFQIIEGQFLKGIPSGYVRIIN